MYKFQVAVVVVVHECHAPRSPFYPADAHRLRHVFELSRLLCCGGSRTPSLRHTAKSVWPSLSKIARRRRPSPLPVNWMPAACVTSSNRPSPRLRKQAAGTLAPTPLTQEKVRFCHRHRSRRNKPRCSARISTRLPPALFDTKGIPFRRKPHRNRRRHIGRRAQRQLRELNIAPDRHKPGAERRSEMFRRDFLEARPDVRRRPPPHRPLPLKRLRQPKLRRRVIRIER